MSPVYLFLIISGYGYYKKFIAGDKPRRAHLISLFLKYWIILACFIMLGLLIGQYDVTELNIKTLFYNFSGYNCTINREVWFLLPFVCLCLCVNWLLNKYDCNPVSFLTLSAVTWFVASYVMSHYHFPLFIVFLLRVVYFTFPFLIGASLAKFRFFEKFDGINDSTRIMMPVMIVLLFYVRMMFSAFPQLLFCLLLAIFVRLSMRPKWLDSVMFYLGKNSTTLWFIHTFICYYLFHDIIYALKFPLLIFMVLISVSLILAYLFDMIHLYCWKKLRALCCRVRLGRGNLTI